MTWIRTLVFFCLFPGSFVAKAEYNGYHIEFDLHLKSGETIHGYQYLAGYIPTPDDMSLAEYVESRKDLLLNNHFEDGLGDYAYHQNRIKYTWGNRLGNKHFIFTLVDKHTIDTSDVKTIDVLEIIPYSYITGVVSSHQMADTVWMKEEHVEYRSFGGYLCAYNVFFHEWNADLEEAVSQAQEQIESVEKEIALLEEDLEYTDGAEYDKIKAKIEELTDSLDQIASDILAPFFDYKVVIIAECTC
jgi:hypothetical protein